MFYNEKKYYDDIEDIQKIRQSLLKEYKNIFSKKFDSKKDDPTESGVWPNLTKEQIKQMNIDIFNYIEENNLGK